MSDWQCEAINRRNQLPGNTRNQLALFYCPRSIPSSPQSYLHIGRLQSRFAIWSRKRCLICQMSNQIHSSATVGWSSVDFKKSSKGVREEVKSPSEAICLSGTIPDICHFLYTGKIFGEYNLHRKTPIFWVKSVKKTPLFRVKYVENANFLR